MDRLAEVVLRRRGSIFAVVTALTVLAVVGYSRLRVENNIAAWFAPDDPGFVRYLEFRGRFETEDLLVAAIGAPDVFTRDVLGRIDRLTHAAKALPGVVRVTSLTSIEDLRGTPDGLEIEPLVADPALDDAALAALRRRVLADPFFPGTIVSRDGRTTVVAIELGPRTAERTAAVIDGLERAITQEAAPGIEIHLAGWPAADLLMNRLTAHDVSREFPLSALVLFLCVALAFRSPGVAAVVMGGVLLTIIWTMGTFSGLGFQGTFVTFSALPGILLALVVATGVHVTARFREEVAAGPGKREAMLRTLRGVAFPILLTSATTAVGFGSLAVSSVPPLRHLGLFAAFGMGVTCLLCLTIVPIGLLTLPGHGPAEERRLGGVLARIAEIDVGRPRTVLAVALALGAIGLVGALQIQPQSSNLHYLPDDSAPVRAMHFLEDRFGGATLLEVVASGPPGVLEEPAAAEAVVAAQQALVARPDVTQSFAYTDLLRRMNQALHDGDPAYYRIPDTREGIAQELLLYETSGGKDLPAMVDVSTYDTARLSARTSAFTDLRAWERLYADVSAELAALEPPGTGLTLRIAGDGPLWLRQNLALLDTMVESFLLALAGISLMMIWVTRSVRLGLLAMVPNVLPILLSVGTMGWVGIHLDFATVTIAATALGIAVDDSIHYLARFRRELAAVGDVPTAARRALRTVGQAMIATSIVLCVGMLSMVTSSFPPHRTFAYVMSLTIAFALAGDLFLLPALLVLDDRRRRAVARPARAA
jgi:predicted RND superfamily exporter protein